MTEDKTVEKLKEKYIASMTPHLRKQTTCHYLDQMKIQQI